ncbi:MAG: SDR family oxidoreductase [Caldilineaceae bacterium]
MVNNAGTTVRKRPELLTQEEWRTVLETNLDGAFLCSQACYPAMQAAGGGVVLNNGSMLSIFGSPCRGLRGVQGGIVQLTKSLAAAWAADNIQVTARLDRHAVDRGCAGRGARSLPRRCRARPPLRGHIDDFQGLAVFLASDVQLHHRRRQSPWTAASSANVV